MPKFPISSDQIKEKTVRISGEEFKHIVKVLRYKEGNNIELFDENYVTHQAVIKDISSKDLVAEISTSKLVKIESNLNINLYQAITKGNKMDLIVQKCGELGVRSITPIYSERTVIQKTGKSKRWSKIAVESCKQSGRTKPLTINGPNSFKEIIKSLSENDLNLLFYENNTVSLKTFLENIQIKNSTVNLVIGPEGGFSEEEIMKAKQQKVNILGLGPRILRAETAAIAAVSIIQFYFGDL